MRCMVIMKANQDSEAGVMPSERVLTEMGNFNEELVKAGVMLAGEGLHPSSKGVRVGFGARQAGRDDGPFAETKELVAGFWLWQVKSMDEAIEWVKRCPNPDAGESEIEIRQVFEAEDFGASSRPSCASRKNALARPPAATGRSVRSRRRRTLHPGWRARCVIAGIAAACGTGVLAVVRPDSRHRVLQPAAAMV